MTSGTNKASNPTPAGQAQPTDSNSDWSGVRFLVQQLLGLISTAMPVQVVAVNTDNCTVDAQLLVNMIDGQGVASPRGQVFGLPYFRNQGGINGIVLDPQVGDIGDVVFCDRDISAVKANRAQSNPGSLRRFSKSDGVYIGGILNPFPTCRLAFVDDGMVLTPDDGTTYIKITPGEIILKAAKITTHATEQNAWDVDGTGFVYQPGQIDTYTDGVPSSHHAPTPPEVPT